MSAAEFSTADGRVKKLLSFVGYGLAFVCSACVPRRAQRWVFGSWVGVGEGALAVAQELQASDPQAQITWVVGNEREAAAASREGFTPVRRHTFAGWWATLTARYIVITHGYRDVNRYGVVGAQITHLGHGAPIKRLHHHVAGMTDGPGFLRSLLRRLYRIGAERVQLYVAGSVTVAERLREASRLDPGRVQVLGDPRDDVVAAQVQHPELALAVRRDVEQLLGLAPDSSASERWILYAPTWRDGEPDPAVPTAQEAAAISTWLADHQARLVIRSHPMGSGAYDAVFASQSGEVTDRVHALPATIAPDITPLLGAFDTVISDYSSIVIDYALLGRPIVWFAPDLEHYSQTRGLYEPLHLTAAGQIVSSWAAVLERLGEVLTAGPLADAAVLDTRALADRFHAYPEGGAARRVLNEIQRLSLPKNARVSRGVFFESFEGRQAACNPRALDAEIARRYPQLPRYWSVTSERVAVPDGATPLLVGGADWHDARRRAQLLIVNDWLRYGFRRRRGQTVLQTWHGTMLKHLALTRPNTGLQTQIAVRRESRRWSLLLSQNAHSTQQFRRSYAYRGEIIEYGYPRDDRLARASAESRAIARRALRVPAGARVLAYVPTWRETQRGRASGLIDLLDVHALAAELDTPDDRWVVVVRGHSRTLHFGGYTDAAGRETGSDHRVIDASAHPDVNDVILAADLLVTDYSSVMFDAAVARTPMAFFVPDLAEYRDRERGFTFDFEATAPGPLLTTRAEVVATARAGVPFGSDYQRWCERFVPHDDGQAAVRVVDELVRRGVL